MNRVSPAADRSEEDLSLIALATVVLRRSSTVWKTALVLAVLAVIYTGVRGVRYVAESKFTPQTSEDRGSRLGGIASQFGLVLPTTGGGETLQFYAELLKSREIIKEVALTKYRIKTGSEPGDTMFGDLGTLYGINGATPEQRARLVMIALGSSIVVTPSLESNLITLRVNAKWPDLATQLNRRLLTLLDERSRELKRGRASEERKFAEARMREVEMELRTAERQLEQFMTGNRSFQSSARQNLEASRLQREVDLKQQLYLSLVQAHEQARLEEVRSSPVIGIIDHPEGSVRGNGGKYVRNAIVGLVLGAFLGMLLALWKEYLDRFRTTQPERYAELHEATSRLKFWRRRAA